MKLIGFGKIIDFCRSCGCSVSTVVKAGFADEDVIDRYGENTISANDAILLLRSVANDRRLSLLEKAMANNVLKTRIPALLGARFRVSHKTGTYLKPRACNDIGIVWLPDAPFLISFLTEAQEDIGDTSQDIARCTHNLVRLITLTF